MDDIKQIAKELAYYRLNRAKETLNDAKLMISNNSYLSANNRSYYSIFHSLRAVLAVDGYDSKKHSGIISEFRKRYIKTNVFPTEISQMISSAFEVRNGSDYDDMYIVDKDVTKKQVENAEFIYLKVEEYLQSIFPQS